MISNLKSINRTKVVFIVIVVAVASIVLWLSFTDFYQNVLGLNVLYAPSERLLSHYNYSKEKTFLMLYWGFPWNLKSYVPSEGPTGDGCEVTHRRDRIAEADVIIFHFTIISSRSLPWKYFRHPDQIFLWWSAENPAVLLAENSDNWSAYDNFFNWTWTYRRDADVLRNYGYRANAIGLPRGTKVVDDIIASKKKLAIWIVSRCDYTAGARRRMALAKELQKAGLNFDGYGKCFPGSPSLPRNTEQMVKIIKEYKFYFAFENGLHCKDYITEKFWYNSLALNAVPIVWGPTKEDILSVAPLDSFIFAEDYENSQKLVEYIKFLDEHDEEYRKYFRWREDENMTDAKMIALTKERYPNLNIQEAPKSLCEVLHEKRERKTVRSLKTEFIENNPKECTE